MYIVQANWSKINSKIVNIRKFGKTVNFLLKALVCQYELKKKKEKKNQG